MPKTPRTKAFQALLARFVPAMAAIAGGIAWENVFAVAAGVGLLLWFLVALYEEWEVLFPNRGRAKRILALHESARELARIYRKEYDDATAETRQTERPFSTWTPKDKRKVDILRNRVHDGFQNMKLLGASLYWLTGLPGDYEAIPHTNKSIDELIRLTRPVFWQRWLNL